MGLPAKLKTIGLGAVLAVATVANAEAGGFSHGSNSFGLQSLVGAHAKAKSHVQAKTKYFNYMSSNYANTSAAVVGKLFAEGNAFAGHDTMFTAYGKVGYEEKNFAKVKVYAKGGNIMAKARSKNWVKIKVKGKVYLVHEGDVAAMVRFTPLGTKAKAIASNHTSFYGRGAISYASGARTSASVRTRR